MVEKHTNFRIGSCCMDPNSEIKKKLHLILFSEVVNFFGFVDYLTSTHTFSEQNMLKFTDY